MNLIDSYRPERHYMRGPGPKWQEKHARHAGSPSLTNHTRPRWVFAVLAAWVFAAAASFAYPVSTAPVQSVQSPSASEDKDAAARPCEARHPAKGANAPFGPRCPQQHTD
jgi:hypothetical protein